MFDHQAGADAQPSTEQLLTTNSKGVARQCTTHSELAIAPIESGFCSVNLIVLISLMQPSCKFRNKICYCNLVVIIL